MNMFKKLIRKTSITLCSVFALITSLSASGQSVISGSLTNGVNLVKTGPGVLYSLQIFNSDIAAQTLTIYDNSSSTSTNTAKGAYNYFTTGRGTNTVIFTNAVGRVETNITIGLVRTSVSVSAITNEATRVFRIIVPASSSGTIIPSQPLTFGLGFQAHLLGTNATYNGFYNPLP